MSEMSKMEADGKITPEMEDAAIDIMVSLVAEDLSDMLHCPVEKAMIDFVQSRTGETLYDRESKLWWDGPSAIVDQYLRETMQDADWKV